MKEPTYVLIFLWLSDMTKRFGKYTFRFIEEYVFLDPRYMIEEIFSALMGTIIWFMIGGTLMVCFAMPYAMLLGFIPTTTTIIRGLIRSYNGWKVMHDLGDA